MWAGCQAEPSKGLTTSCAGKQQSPEALSAEGWACHAICRTSCGKGPRGREMPSPRGYPVSPGKPAFKMVPAASQGHIFWITIQPLVLFHSQIQFGTRVCKASIYEFVLGLCQLATDSDARTIIISLADRLWQKGCIVSVGSAGCGSLSSRPYQYKLLSYPQDDVTNPLHWLSHSEALQGFQLHFQSWIYNPYHNSAVQKKCM